MPIYGACMIWKKSQIHLPFLLFVNICTNERAGRIQVLTYAPFSKAGVLLWKKLIYFLLCYVTRRFWREKLISANLYHLFRKCTFYFYFWKIILNSFLWNEHLISPLFWMTKNFFRQFICVPVMEFKYDRPVSFSAFLV